MATVEELRARLMNSIGLYSVSDDKAMPEEMAVALDSLIAAVREEGYHDGFHEGYLSASREQTFRDGVEKGRAEGVAMTCEQEVLNQKARVLERMRVDPDDKHSAFENECIVRNLIEFVTQQAVHDHLRQIGVAQKFVVPDGPVKIVRKPGLLFPEIKGKRHHTVPGLLFEVIEKGHKVIEMIREQVKCDQEGDYLFDECFNLEDALDAFDEIYFNQETP